MKILLSLFASFMLIVSTAFAQCDIYGAEIVQGYCNNHPHEYTHNMVIYGEAENVGSQGWEFITPFFASGPLPYDHHPNSNQVKLNYILPIEEAYCGDAFWVTIRDVEFPNCTLEHYYEPMYCCCDIKNIYVDTQCVGPEQFQITVDLEINGGDPTKPNFDLNFQTNQGYSLFNGKFQLADLPVTIGPFDADGQGYIVTVEKTGILDYCTLQKEVSPMFCIEPGCSIAYIYSDKLPCDESDQTYYIELDFHIENPGNLGFSLYDDYCDCSFVYSYTDLPLILGPYPGDCQTNVQYTIKDLEYECEDTYVLSAGCCNPSSQCIMSNLMLDTICMGTDSFKLSVHFQVTAGSTDGFLLYVNDELQDTFDYADLPIVLGPFPADCNTQYRVYVEDMLDDVCATEMDIIAPCCYPVCSISNLLLTPSCYTEDSMTLFIEFEVANGGLDGFELWLNDSLNAVHHYADLPIEMDPILTDCASSYILSVVDIHDPNCKIDALLDDACCAMMIPHFSVWEIDTFNHNGNSFELVIQFEVTQPGSMGWKIQVNDIEVGPYDYDTSFPVLGPFDVDCEESVFVTLYDVQHPAGRKKLEITDLCCLSSPTVVPSTDLVHYRMLPNGLLVLENALPMPITWSLHNILGQPIVGRKSMEAGSRLDFQIPPSVAGMVVLHIGTIEMHSSVLLSIH